MDSCIYIYSTHYLSDLTLLVLHNRIAYIRSNFIIYLFIVLQPFKGQIKTLINGWGEVSSTSQRIKRDRCHRRIYKNANWGHFIFTFLFSPSLSHLPYIHQPSSPYSPLLSFHPSPISPSFITPHSSPFTPPFCPAVVSLSLRFRNE